ncbi:hypothetical protein CALK_1647 [Chitinivibrio alkaliphilus ACht1]|uniref:Uncharacterized protein n=1 Tax=Chitinivibrio alkaliphilus ACht1 TaxID=1313304 RepID=U7D7A2_9BACT|nr:hypothetical protein CALK_1647 [Chitinivibrio alkaliphilus ACht1]
MTDKKISPGVNSDFPIVKQIHSTDSPFDRVSGKLLSGLPIP